MRRFVHTRSSTQSNVRQNTLHELLQLMVAGTKGNKDEEDRPRQIGVITVLTRSFAHRVTQDALTNPAAKPAWELLGRTTKGSTQSPQVLQQWR